MSYCAAVRQGGLGAEHKRHHDHEYGFPLEDDSALFERLVLEINQAGLSWTTILRKQEAFRAAFAQTARDLGAPGRDPEFGDGLIELAGACSGDTTQ